MHFVESRSLQLQNQYSFYQIYRNYLRQKLTLQIIRLEGNSASATKTGSYTLQRFSLRSLVVLSSTTLFITKNFLLSLKLLRNRGYTLAVQSSLSRYIPTIRTYNTSLLRRNLVGARFVRQNSCRSSILKSTIRRGTRMYIWIPLANSQTILRNLRLQALYLYYFKLGVTKSVQIQSVQRQDAGCRAPSLQELGKKEPRTV